MPFDSVPKMSAPRSVPIIVARPPDKLVPPMTTAVMTWSSRTRPMLPGVTPLVRDAAISAATAVSTAVIKYTATRTRVTGMPDKRAASALPPTAKA